MIKYGLNIASAALVGLLIGIASFYLALRRLPALEHLKLDGWYSTSPSLVIQQSPYELAHRTIAHSFPLETNEDIILKASFDASGRRLDSQCIYELIGPFPSASLFTLYTIPLGRAPLASNQLVTLENNGKTPIAALLPFELSSTNILAPYNNDYKIRISSINHALSGNWLAAPATGKFTLVLSLYNSPYLRARAAEKLKLPPIHRISCNKLI